ncbi:MAG: hypothetical protein ABI229_05030 [Gemmatimonadaceae bacterium]
MTQADITDDRDTVAAILDAVTVAARAAATDLTWRAAGSFDGFWELRLSPGDIADTRPSA